MDRDTDRIGVANLESRSAFAAPVKWFRLRTNASMRVGFSTVAIVGKLANAGVDKMAPAPMITALMNMCSPCCKSADHEAHKAHDDTIDGGSGR